MCVCVKAITRAENEKSDHTRNKIGGINRRWTSLKYQRNNHHSAGGAIVSTGLVGDCGGLGDVGNPSTAPVAFEYMFKDDPRLGANAGGTFTLSPLLFAVFAAFDVPDACRVSGGVIRIVFCCCWWY